MANNPIKSVDGVAIPCPSSYVWKLEDVSASDAGRDESTVMDKAMLGQIVGLELGWKYVTTAVGSQILQAFNPEYVTIEYLDLKAGGYVTSVFYTGNRSSQMYNATMDLWESISFNVIKRSGV